MEDFAVRLASEQGVSAVRRVGVDRAGAAEAEAELTAREAAFNRGGGETAAEGGIAVRLERATGLPFH